MSGNPVPLGLKLHIPLALESCPHCGTVRLYIGIANQQAPWVFTVTPDGKKRIWEIYTCSSCAKVVVAAAAGEAAGTQVRSLPCPKISRTRNP
jgi:hypothetical protein